eukprot:s5200_g5.t1
MKQRGWHRAVMFHSMFMNGTVRRADLWFLEYSVLPVVQNSYRCLREAATSPTTPSDWKKLMNCVLYINIFGINLLHDNLFHIGLRYINFLFQRYCHNLNIIFDHDVFYNHDWDHIYILLHYADHINLFICYDDINIRHCNNIHKLFCDSFFHDYFFCLNDVERILKHFNNVHKHIEHII